MRLLTMTGVAVNVPDDYGHHLLENQPGKWVDPDARPTRSRRASAPPASEDDTE